jgi:hypothetical protein
MLSDVTQKSAPNKSLLLSRRRQVHSVSILTDQEPVKIVKADLAKIREAWNRYQAETTRKAVYVYLTVVYNVVARWRRKGVVDQYCGLALEFQAREADMEPEPFAIVIYCTSDPRKVDRKTRSKWSRALRVVQACKEPDQSVRATIKGLGGINERVAVFPSIR